MGWGWMNVLCYYLRLAIPQKALSDIQYSSLVYFVFNKLTVVVKRGTVCWELLIISILSSQLHMKISYH